VVGDFQRLEFVGDKILGLVIADLLYDCYPAWEEGRLTQESSVLVRNKGPLAEIARKLGLGDFLIMGRGEESLGLRDDNKVLSDAMEALLGALWIDTHHNYAFMQQFIQTHWSALDLLPTVRYEQLIQILHHVDMPTYDKVAQLKQYLQQHLEVPILNQFLLALVAHSGSGEEEALSEVVATVLEKGVTQDALNTALTAQLSDCWNCSPPYVDLLLRHTADPNTRKNSSDFSLLRQY
jgi:dsRNA-specific ribonuclease